MSKNAIATWVMFVLILGSCVALIILLSSSSLEAIKALEQLGIVLAAFVMLFFFAKFFFAWMSESEDKARKK